jgi:hypothetical protein
MSWSRGGSTPATRGWLRWNTVATWDANGSHSFGPVGTDWKIEGARDVNGDGKTDILWRQDGGAVAIWDMDGGTVIGSQLFAPVSNDWHIVT